VGTLRRFRPDRCGFSWKRGKEKGFIPAGISWDNTPWKTEILPQQPLGRKSCSSRIPPSFIKWDSLTWSAVNRHTIVSGHDQRSKSP